MNKAIPSQITIQPIISYPREAEIGKTYLMTVDVQVVLAGDWPYLQEDHALHCVLDASPLFNHQSLGDSIIVINRFGGTYGPATFLLTAKNVAQDVYIEVKLINESGILVYSGLIEQIKVISPGTHLSMPEGSSLEKADIVHRDENFLRMPFVNQKRALWAIEQQLLTSEPYVFVTAPVSMGKSYLLNELKRRCTTGELQPNSTNGDDGPQEWFCAHINLKNVGKKLTRPQDLITQLSNALRGSSATNGSDLARQIRVHEKSGERILFLINGTEFLDEETAQAFHRLLGDLEKRLGDIHKFNPAIVAVGRLSHPSWENSYSPKMKAVEIEPFSAKSIEEILRKVKPSRSVRDHWYEYQAKQIYACTSGHPGCIAAMVQYLYENDWTIPDPDNDSTFLEVLAPIIEKEILVPNNLDGHGTTNGVIYEQLSRVFLELSTYRIITPELIEDVALKLGLKTDKVDLLRLEEHIVQSLLVKWDSDRGWYVMLRSVRQLLERWLSIMHEDRLERHRYAFAMYNKWLNLSQERPARPPVQGDVQITYICEAIYHYVICLGIKKPVYGDVSKALFSHLAYRLWKYNRSLKGSSAQRLGKMLRGRLHDDTELHEFVDELFDAGAYNRLIEAIDTMPRFDNAYALIIGINSYQHVGPLSKAANDAVDVHNLLIDDSICGYHPENVRLLTDEKANRLAFFEAMNWLSEQADEAATVTIFFFGHGGQSPENNSEGYLLLDDTNPWSSENPLQIDVGRLKETAVTTQEFTLALNQIKAQKIMVVLDTSHSGGSAHPKSPFFNRRLLQQGLPEQTYDALKRGMHNRVIIASCSPHQVSWEKETMRNGIFTDALLKGLGGEAASEVGVGSLDLFAYVSQEVPIAVQGIINPFTGKPAEQNPYLRAETAYNYIIALPPSSTRGLDMG